MNDQLCRTPEKVKAALSLKADGLGCDAVDWDVAISAPRRKTTVAPVFVKHRGRAKPRPFRSDG